MNVHSQLGQIVLDDGGHSASLIVRRTGNDGEFHYLALRIQQLTIVAPGESRRLQKLTRPLHRTRRMRQSLIDPQPVGGTHIAPQRHRSRPVYQLYDRFPIDGSRNCLPEFEIREPLLLFRNLIQASLELIEVKH